jgi:hypothetical protein
VIGSNLTRIFGGAMLEQLIGAIAAALTAWQQAVSG